MLRLLTETKRERRNITGYLCEINLFLCHSNKRDKTQPAWCDIITK